MADAATTPAVTVSGVQDQTPVATMGFGAREQADARRQAGFREADDAVADVQMNDIYSRSQALTVDVVGKSFSANTDLREKMADANSDWREIHKGRLFGAKKDA